MRNLLIVAAVLAIALTIWSAETTQDANPSTKTPAPRRPPRPDQQEELSSVEVILKSGDRGYAIADMLKAAKQHVKGKYPTFSLTNANVTIWVEPTVSTNSVKIFFGHGFEERMIGLSVGIDGSLIEHSSFIAKEGNGSDHPPQRASGK